VEDYGDVPNVRRQRGGYTMVGAACCPPHHPHSTNYLSARTSRAVRGTGDIEPRPMPKSVEPQAPGSERREMEFGRRHRGHKIGGGEQGGTGISNITAVDQRGQSAARHGQPVTRRGTRSGAELLREPAEAVAERTGMDASKESRRSCGETSAWSAGRHCPGTTGNRGNRNRGKRGKFTTSIVSAEV
jgi:hypothetical protein